MPRVLLNATNGDLATIGGDFTHYLDLLEIGKRVSEWEFRLLERSNGRSRYLRRLSQRSLSVRMPRQLNQLALWYARSSPIPEADVRETHPALLYSVVRIGQLPHGCKVPQVWYSQGISPPAYYHWYGGVTQSDVVNFYRRAATHVSVMVVGTRNCAQRLNGLLGDLPCPVVVVPQLTLVPPILDPTQKVSTHLHLLFVGRDYRRKGLIETLEAYRQLKAKHSNLELSIVTKPDPGLLRMIAKLTDVRLYSGVTRHQLLHLYEISHVLVVPTHADTYNLSMVEAMAKGCAIVSSDMDPLGEIAPHGEVGYLVRPGDVQALESALEALVTDRESCRRFGIAALARYRESFSPEVLIPRLLDAFHLAINLGR